MVEPEKHKEDEERPHRHLAVLAPSSSHEETAGQRVMRIAVVVLALLSVVLFSSSYKLSWWRFWLYAPQYPKGLGLTISLTGMGGDVHEIDLLNHYIGMKHLEDAAALERRLAIWGVIAIAVVTFALLVLAGKKLNKLVAIPALMFPVVFLADSLYWLYSFGHQLDPKAPLHIAPFTPQLFGNGQIGQFETFARPELGFWVALGGVACVVTATILRARVCRGCADAKSCKGVCPRAMIRGHKAVPS